MSIMLRQIGEFISGADEATAAASCAAELPQGQAGGVGMALPEGPRYRGGIDDMEW